VTDIDLILASDVLYNVGQLKVVPAFLSLLAKNVSSSPTILLSYKSRHEELDSNLFEAFDKNGFDGEQASAEELHEDLLSEPIDIFILYPKDKQQSGVVFPKAS
jgi:hypothetical protein